MNLMKPMSITAASILVLSVLMISPEVSLIKTATAGELDLSDAQNAKLGKHKAKRRVEQNESQKDYAPGASEDTGQEEECGTVDIGNVFNDGGFGGPKKIDVIITGDIINANNDCD